MFNLFRKKGSSSIKIIDKVWMNEEAKFAAIGAQLKKQEETFFIFWFDDTRRRAESFLASDIFSSSLFTTAREVVAQIIAGKKIIFAEHYPLLQKEKDLFEKLHLPEVQIWSSLNEPLFNHFGGERIVEMMKKLGMKENESVEHKLLTQSIHKAQEKIQTKVMMEQSANSQQEWMERNFSS